MRCLPQGRRDERFDLLPYLAGRDSKSHRRTISMR
jgi:hypothetical protein